MTVNVGTGAEAPPTNLNYLPAYLAGSMVARWLWRRIAPPMPADKFNGSMLVVNPDPAKTRYRDPASKGVVTAQGIASRYPRSRLLFEGDKYSVAPFGHEVEYGHDDLIQYGDQVAVPEVALMQAAAVVELETELDVMGLLTDETLTPPSGNTGKTLTASNSFYNVDEDPVKNVIAPAKAAAIAQGATEIPNSMVVSYEAALMLCANKNVKFNVTSAAAQNGVISPELIEQRLSEALTVNVLISQATYKEPNEAGTDALRYALPLTYAWIGYIDAEEARGLAASRPGVDPMALRLMKPQSVRTITLNAPRQGINGNGDPWLGSQAGDFGLGNRVLALAHRRPKFFKRGPRFLVKGVNAVA
jgi:hypothetical protein